MNNAPVKPVYVLYGDDAFLLEAHRKEILHLAIGDADPQTCVAFYDATAELAQVLDELRTLPFLAPHRVIIIRGAGPFISAHRELLEKYLTSPSATGTLVLTVSSWDRRTRLFKLVQKVGAAIDCNVPARGVRQWLMRAARKRGKKLAPDAAELLMTWVGNDLSSLNMEIEKLAIYTGGNETITARDVSELVTATAGAGAFAMTDALIAGDTRAALKALDAMLTARGEEFRVLGLIASHLRRALGAQQLSAEGKSPESALPPRMPYRAKNAFLAMLKRRDLATLQRDFRSLIRTDLGMKTGLNGSAALRELVISLCR